MSKTLITTEDVPQYIRDIVVQEHFWIDDVAKPSGAFSGDKSHQRKAYREGFRNYISVVITDPVAYRFEKDNFYRERKKELAAQISSASGDRHRPWHRAGEIKPDKAPRWDTFRGSGAWIGQQ